MNEVTDFLILKKEELDTSIELYKVSFIQNSIQYILLIPFAYKLLKENEKTFYVGNEEEELIDYFKENDWKNKNNEIELLSEKEIEE